MANATLHNSPHFCMIGEIQPDLDIEVRADEPDAARGVVYYYITIKATGSSDSITISGSATQVRTLLQKVGALVEAEIDLKAAS